MFSGWSARNSNGGGGGGGGVHYPSREDLRRRTSGSGSGSGGNAAQQSPQQPESVRGPARVRFPDEDCLSDPPSLLGHVMMLISALLALICIVGLLTILIVLYFTVRPFSQSFYRRLAAQIGAAAFLDAIAVLLPDVTIYLTGDSDVPSLVGTSFLVSNHLVDGDWWGLLMLGRCIGLRGSMKVFLRDEFLNINTHHRGSDNNNALNRVATSGSVVPVHTPNKPLAASTSQSSSSSANTNTTNTTNNTTGGRTEANANGSSPPSSSSNLHGNRRHCAQELTLMARLLHLFLEFPLINGEDYVSDRENLFQLLRSFAENSGSYAPVHLVFFPEGWSIHNGADRNSILAKSNEFAKRERRPQLKHLLLPRTRGFSASLDCLRDSSPLVYDVTMAYGGYDGSLPPAVKLSIRSLWKVLHNFPKEIHLRIKRYSMEEVLQDTSWLDKKWAEKDRLLSHFARNQTFPVDSRGYHRNRVFHTRTNSLESSALALVRLLLVPCTVPILLLLSIPLFWALLGLWWSQWVIRHLFQTLVRQTDSGYRSPSHGADTNMGDAAETSGSTSANGTPFVPATPFVTPTSTSWRGAIS